MSDYPLPYASLTAQYSPQTTVAINLRQFEKDSKAQAEREYDAVHGPLPEPPADDDLSIDAGTRLIQKKKRKVRSAIVSRRKSAIYVEKLEAELEMRDNVNADLETRLGVFRDVLRETSSRISALQDAMQVSGSNAPGGGTDARKRLRAPGAGPLHFGHGGGAGGAGASHAVVGGAGYGAGVVPYGGAGRGHGAGVEQQPPASSNDFFEEVPGPIDDILSISPEEILPGMYAQQQQQQQAGLGGARGKEEVARLGGHGRRGADFSSECSAADVQTSPVTPKLRRLEPPSSAVSAREDSHWRGAALPAGLVSHTAPYRALAM